MPEVHGRDGLHRQLLVPCEWLSHSSFPQPTSDDEKPDVQSIRPSDTHAPLRQVPAKRTSPHVSVHAAPATATTDEVLVPDPVDRDHDDLDDDV